MTRSVYHTLVSYNFWVWTEQELLLGNFQKGQLAFSPLPLSNTVVCKSNASSWI